MNKLRKVGRHIVGSYKDSPMPHRLTKSPAESFQNLELLFLLQRMAFPELGDPIRMKRRVIKKVGPSRKSPHKMGSVKHVPVFDLTQAYGGALSRSEARRLVFGLEKFRSIEFDFSGVPEIGQAFADELFRVFPNSHPTIKVSFANANAAVAFMIGRAMANR